MVWEMRKIREQLEKREQGRKINFISPYLSLASLWCVLIDRSRAHSLHRLNGSVQCSPKRDPKRWHQSRVVRKVAGLAGLRRVALRVAVVHGQRARRTSCTATRRYVARILLLPSMIGAGHLSTNGYSHKSLKISWNLGKLLPECTVKILR